MTVGIITHRGFWNNEIKQNSIDSFKKAFEFGFGVETDVRDHNGDLVISHDIPDGDSIKLEELFKLYSKEKMNTTLALNIKSDGLQKLLSALLNKYKISNYFVFDMSIPETIKYRNANFKFYTRRSEYETKSLLEDKTLGVWIDIFEQDWFTKQGLSKIKVKNICFVSPELHKKKYLEYWKKLKKIIYSNKEKNFYLCTDYPLEGHKFFND